MDPTKLLAETHSAGTGYSRGSFVSHHTGSTHRTDSISMASTNNTLQGYHVVITELEDKRTQYELKFDRKRSRSRSKETHEVSQSCWSCFSCANSVTIVRGAAAEAIIKKIIQYVPSQWANENSIDITNSAIRSAAAHALGIPVASPHRDPVVKTTAASWQAPGEEGATTTTVIAQPTGPHSSMVAFLDRTSEVGGDRP